LGLSLCLLSACAPKSETETKPELPITVSLRKAIMGPGNVAIFNTTIKSPVPILVTLHSSAFGTDKRFELHLEPAHSTELGHMEGAVIENGDTITIENQNYASRSFKVNL
jgi:hypothetical protein